MCKEVKQKERKSQTDIGTEIDTDENRMGVKEEGGRGEGGGRLEDKTGRQI